VNDPKTRRRRPWLAAALALLVSGLGHAYLRRWARAFGRYAVITATLVFVVPDATVEKVIAGDRPPIAEIAPALVAVGASVVDAYVLALRNNRAHEQRAPSTETVGDASQPSDCDEATRSDAVEIDRNAPASDRTTDSVANTVSCPHCGRETDAELDFCQRCTESLDE